MSSEDIWLSLIILLSSLLQGMFGFAFMLFALPLSSLLISIKIAVPLLSLFLALIAGVLAFRMRGRFNFRDIIPLLIGALIGIPFGICFLMRSSEGFIKSTLGIMLIAYSLYSLLVKKMPFRLPLWTGYLFGFFAGSLGGAFNVTGPPVIVFILTQGWSRVNTIGTLNFFFFITSLLIVIFHIVMGNINTDILITFLKFTPVVIAGMLIGTYVFRKTNDKNYKKCLFILLIIMGVTLLL